MTRQIASLTRKAARRPPTTVTMTGRANGDHRGAREEGVSRRGEARARNAARRNANIGQNEDDERSEVLGTHSPAAASIASGSMSRVLARSSRVSGINKAKTHQG